MIPRYQKIIFIVLLVSSLVMGGILWKLRERAHQRLVAGEDSSPTQAPEVAPSEQATLLIANDTDNSLVARAQSLPLPNEPGARARAVLSKLLDLYASPDAGHPVPGGAASITQVFLLPAPPPVSAGDDEEKPRPTATGSGQLAVVDLKGTFAASHPSGLETETLTILSICGTLHANLPDVTQVRFLVDGQPRATLAGHVDLTRTYLASDAATTADVQR